MAVSVTVTKRMPPSTKVVCNRDDRGMAGSGKGNRPSSYGYMYEPHSFYRVKRRSNRCAAARANLLIRAIFGRSAENSARARRRPPGLQAKMAEPNQKVCRSLTYLLEKR